MAGEESSMYLQRSYRATWPQACLAARSLSPPPSPICMLARSSLATKRLMSPQGLHRQTLVVCIALCLPVGNAAAPAATRHTATCDLPANELLVFES